MKRYRLTLALILATSLPLAASCATPTPTPTSTPRPTPVKAVATVMHKFRDPVTIVFWHSEPEGTPSVRLLGELTRRFESEHPWITVRPAYVGNYEDVYRKALAAVRVGNPPDVAATYEHRIAELMGAGAIVPLNPYLNDPQIGLTDEDREDIFVGFWETNRYPEFGYQTLSLPYAKGALALYYNLTALRQAGIDAPPRTWDEFEQACQAVAKGDVAGYAYVERATTFAGWLYSRGASLLGDEDTRAVFNGPEGVEALELLKRLLASGAAVRPEGEHADRAMFAAGKAVFTMDSTSALPAYAQAVEEAGLGFEWGSVAIPQKDSGRARTVLYGPSLCVFKTDEARQQAAWRFIRWLTDTEQNARWASTLGYAPLRRSAVEWLAESGWLADNKVASEMYETVIPGALPEPNVRGEQGVRRAIEGAWLASAGGVKPPQQALDEAVGKANEALVSTN